MSNIMKKGKSQQRKVAVAFPKGLFLRDPLRTHGLFWFMSRTKASRMLLQGASAQLDGTGASPPQERLLRMRTETLPSTHPRKTLLIFL